MIEIQIYEKELYDELKQYAIYSSDLTHVCSFRDSMSDILKSKGLVFEEVKQEIRKPLLTITGRNIMKLEHAPAEMLYFVGCRTEYDPTIPVRFMNEVRLLIESGLVEVSDKFKEVYSKMGYRNKINDLVCSNIKFYGKGKLTDFIDGDLTIQSLKLNDLREKPIIYKQMHLIVEDALTDQVKYVEMKCKTYNPDKCGTIPEHNVTLRFYVRNPLLKTIAFKGNKISIATSKITEGKNNNFVIYDPFIIPQGLNYTKDIMYTPKTRTIPVELFRMAMYEFICRYNLE